jgi:hypothetical protein
MTAAKPRKSNAPDHVYAEFVRRAREVLGHAHEDYMVAYDKYGYVNNWMPDEAWIVRAESPAAQHARDAASEAERLYAGPGPDNVVAWTSLAEDGWEQEYAPMYSEADQQRIRDLFIDMKAAGIKRIYVTAKTAPRDPRAMSTRYRVRIWGDYIKPLSGYDPSERRNWLHVPNTTNAPDYASRDEAEEAVRLWEAMEPTTPNGTPIPAVIESYDLWAVHPPAV